MKKKWITIERNNILKENTYSKFFLHLHAKIIVEVRKQINYLKEDLHREMTYCFILSCKTIPIMEKSHSILIDILLIDIKSLSLSFFFITFKNFLKRSLACIA